MNLNPIRTACANSTYTYIFNNCNQLHAREFGEDQNKELTEDGPNLQSLEFWVKLCTLSGTFLILITVKNQFISAFIIEEDKTIYSKYMNIMTVDVTYVSSIEIWNLYINDLSFAMEEHAQNKNCTTTGNLLELPLTY